MIKENLLKTSIELIDKIEKQNDEYFSHQMASYSKIFKELEDLKELIQKQVNEQKFTITNEKVCSIVDSVLLPFYGNKARDLAVEVSYIIINALEKGSKETLYKEIREAFTKRGYLYGFNGNYLEAVYLTNKITDLIMEANDNDR